MKLVCNIPMEDRLNPEVLNDPDVYVIRSGGFDCERFRQIKRAEIRDILNPDSIVLRITIEDKMEEEASE